MLPFVGRKRELQKLNDLNHLNRASLVVVKGRRRIGKSRLIQEFAKNKRFLSFSGLPITPTTTLQTQLGAFAQQLSRSLELPLHTFTDWSEALYYLTDHLTNQPTIILFDEISWMGDKDHTFVPKLKAWWDTELQKYPKLILVFCGSVSLWIEKNIINSTAFFGRITLQITLEELTLPECNTLLRKLGFKGSIDDIFKIVSVTGGVPWYLEQINPQKLADDNIRNLCFEKDGSLTLEFDTIFHDLFNGHGSIYKKIIHILANGMKDIGAIGQELDEKQERTSLHDIMKTLITAGYVTQHFSWSLKTERIGRRSIYRLSDNYLRFFIKYIEPNLGKIRKGSYQDISLQTLPAWDTIMGLQVENLLLNNRPLLLKPLAINPVDIVADNPYIQRATKQHKGCQIDYLIQMITKNIFVCEFKFQRRELKAEIIEEVKSKIKKLAAPRGVGIVPVLFHLSGVVDSVHESRYFYRIVDIADLLEES